MSTSLESATWQRGLRVRSDQEARSHSERRSCIAAETWRLKGHCSRVGYRRA